MIPGQFDYVRPGSLDEALRILRDREGEAKILSGGYSLIPLIKLRLAQPALLVDIQAITGLDGITEDGAGLHIGSRATHRQIHENAIVDRALPAPPRRVRWHRRPAGPQLGHDRRLGRARGPRLGLAGGAARPQRDDRLPRRRRRPRDRGPRLLPRHVHHGHRAHGGARRGPHHRPPAGLGWRVHEARAAGRRLRDRRRRRAHDDRRRRDDQPGRHRRHRGLGVAVRGPERRGAAHRASSPATRRSAPPERRPPRPATPPATSAVRSTTSARWSRS